jgi:predicted ATP-grasp superfamily ATP-dependent carboligase
MERVLICGTSTRAAAESAARAGFPVTAVDAFADRDQHPQARALSAPRDLHVPATARAMARAVRSIERDAVVYLSPFENHPRAVAALAAHGTVWGNSPDTLRRVRNPFELAAVLRRHGFAVPRLRANDSNGLNGPSDSSVWLQKPFRSGGGNRIREWSGERVPADFYLQERIEGVPGSVVFAAANARVVPLGLSRQLVGDSNFGAAGHRFCGSILCSLDDPWFAGRELYDAASALASCVAAEFGLVGLNGIDFIARDGTPYPLEVNPRWSSSIEVAERAFDATFFAAHVEACTTGILPAFDCRAALARVGAVGKAIVYAREDLHVGSTSEWLRDPHVRDIPWTGEKVHCRQPICSVFATAEDGAGCYRLLVSRAERIYTGLQSGVSAARGTGGANPADASRGRVRSA